MREHQMLMKLWKLFLMLMVRKNQMLTKLWKLFLMLMVRKNQMLMGLWKKILIGRQNRMLMACYYFQRWWLLLGLHM